MEMTHVPDSPPLGAALDHAMCCIRTRNDVAQMQRFRPDWKQVKPRF
jgi:glucarate dehydratase